MNQPNHVFVGIDWADASHDYHLIDNQGGQHVGSFEQKPEAIENIIAAWRKKYPRTTLLLAIETTKGALINALIGYDDVVIYPINPAALANYRKAFAHGGGKNDPTDAMRLAQYLQHYLDQLRPLHRDQPITRELGALAEDRRRLVDRRADLANELTAILKQYFPAVLALAAAKPYARFLLRFVIKYPTLADAQRAGRNRLRKFFYGVGAKAKAEERVDVIVSAKPLCQDEVLLRTLSRRAVALCQRLNMLSSQINRYETDIKALVIQHADYRIVAALPGASAFTHARMIAALGDDRDRYPDAQRLQVATGIAPVTIQSGRTKTVHSRWACPKFTRQTFHEYAGQSITRSRWAKAYYDLQISRRKSPQTARRALAYKWQRIIHRCWQDRVSYDEDRYIERLKETGSPLYELIQSAN